MDVAEWLGHLIGGWPVWLVAIAVVVFCIVGGLLIMMFGDGVGGAGAWWPFKRKQRNKK